MPRSQPGLLLVLLDTPTLPDLCSVGDRAALVLLAACPVLTLRPGDLWLPLVAAATMGLLLPLPLLPLLPALLLWPVRPCASPPWPAALATGWWWSSWQPCNNANTSSTSEKLSGWDPADATISTPFAGCTSRLPLLRCHGNAVADVVAATARGVRCMSCIFLSS